MHSTIAIAEFSISPQQINKQSPLWHLYNFWDCSEDQIRFRTFDTDRFAESKMKKIKKRKDEAQQKIITGRKTHESNKFVYFSYKHILYIID